MRFEDIPEDLLPTFPKSFTASTRYGTLELWQSGNGSATQQTYFVSVDDVGIYITIKLIGLADEQSEGETVYDCEFTENYYNYETEQEEEWDDGSCTLTVFDDNYSEIEDIGYSITSGIDAVIGKSTKKSKGGKMARKSIRKEEKYVDIDDDDVVEIEEEDGQKKVEIESKEEHDEEVESGEESEDDNLNQSVKSRKFKKMKKSAIKKADIWMELEDAVWRVLSDFGVEGDFAGNIFSDDFMEFIGDSEDYGASTKKSRMAKLNKKLNKLGGFTKEDEDEEDDFDGDDSARATGHPADWEEDEDEIIDEEEDMVEESCKGCKSKKTRKAFRTSKKVRKDQLDYDADDQQEVNEKGSGSAGKELPEDANEQQDINEKGSGSAGKELPEDADEQQDIKESRRKSARKNVNKSVRPIRKYSVTNGGSPSQDSYLHRYQQSPMVRNAIDGRSNVEKFDEVGMLQQRLNEMNKSKRNARNNVPQRLR